MNIENDASGGFKLNFLLANPPFPPETFPNIILLYCKYQHYDLAVSIAIRNGFWMYFVQLRIAPQNPKTPLIKINVYNSLSLHKLPKARPYSHSFLNRRGDTTNPSQLLRFLGEEFRGNIRRES